MALTNNVKVNARPGAEADPKLVKPDAVELITGDQAPVPTDSPLRQFPRVNLLP